jgi:hypothetical protein
MPQEAAFPVYASFVPGAQSRAVRLCSLLAPSTLGITKTVCDQASKMIEVPQGVLLPKANREFAATGSFHLLGNHVCCQALMLQSHAVPFSHMRSFFIVIVSAFMLTLLYQKLRLAPVQCGEFIPLYQLSQACDRSELLFVECGILPCLYACTQATDSSIGNILTYVSSCVSSFRLLRSGAHHVF